ncbi:inorganic phosphate transporter, partial [Moraxella sp.]|uniref:inorganic phosphate transporter n=1 Tax=Moraxella sp. TaxID=479 RepID=UPI0026279EAB
SVKQVIVIAIIFEFLGAVLAGGHVTQTIRKGIIDPAPIINNPEILVFGMLAALLAAGFWLMFASTKGWPVSTSHSIVGAIVGFAIVGIGPEAVNWHKILSVVISWVISPAVGGVISFLLVMSTRKLILDTDTPLKNAKKYAPAYVFLVAFIISLVTMFKGLKHLNLDLAIWGSLGVSVCFGIIISVVGWLLTRRIEENTYSAQTLQFASVE